MSATSWCDRSASEKAGMSFAGALEWNFHFGQDRRRTVVVTALPGAAMTRVTAGGEVEAPAVCSIPARRRVLRLNQSGCHDADCGSGQRDARYTLERLHWKSPQRGSVTTSTTAVSPRLTTAMARASAGARSCGSVIGPSP